MYCIRWCDRDPIQGQGQGHGAFEIATVVETVHAGGDDRSFLAGLSGCGTCFHCSWRVNRPLNVPPKPRRRKPLATSSHVSRAKLFGGTIQEYVEVWWQYIFTFYVRHSRGEMYSGHGRLSVCVLVWLSLATFPHYCTYPAVTLEDGSGCSPVVHYWADLQSVHGYCCYDSMHCI